MARGEEMKCHIWGRRQALAKMVAHLWNIEIICNYMHLLANQYSEQRCKYEENPNQCKLFTNFRSFIDSLGGKKKQFAKQNAKEKSLTKLQTSNFDFRSVDLNVVKMYK